MNKIVELLIDWDEMDFGDTGVDIMSLVSEPAIGISWQKFAAQKFVEVKPGESEDDYVSRCIPVLIGEGFDSDQAAAICYGSYDEMAECEDCFDLDEACWPGYEAIGMKTKNGKKVPNCVPIENQKFATYSDYPEAAKNNAKRAIEYAEENGWGSCGTDVGKQRAHQLAKGENISEDTIARMASFKRHEQYKDVPYTEGCGGLMWDAWGGSAGVNWAQSKLKDIRDEMSEDQLDAIELMLQDASFGSTFDPKTTTFVDMSKEYFADADEVIQGIGALNNLLDAGDEIESRYVYKYTGSISSNSRRFCRIMMQANRFFSLQEINDMSSAGVNGEFAERGRTRYDIFKYHGGSYCKHYWSRFRVYTDANNREVVVEEGPAAGLAGVETDDQRNRGRVNFESQQFHFSEDKQIVTAPAMVPNMLIPRKDADGNMFHVYFSQDTVRKIAAKFLEENKQHNTDINHDDNVSTENTLLESWIVEDPDMDKSKTLGFNVPPSTWMVSYKINDDKTWKKIKNGELNGFSIAGQFIESNTKY